jgi:hypothetical protein
MVMTSAAPGYVLTGSPDDFDPVLRLIGDALCRRFFHGGFHRVLPSA